MTRILIVDDDPAVLDETCEAARRAGFAAVTASNGPAALAILAADPAIEAVVLDLVMPDSDGMAMLAAISRDHRGLPVLVTAGAPDLELTTTLLQHGAADVIGKPVAPERLLLSLRTAIRLAAQIRMVDAERHRRSGTLSLADIVRSPAFDRGLAIAHRAGRTPTPVLIEGEAGVGKQTLARIIHGSGDRAGRPFVMRSCRAPGHEMAAAALATDLLAAHNGTLLLTEIGLLPAAGQQTLLRFIESGEVAAAPGKRPERPNTRVIGTSRARLLDLTRAGIVREDLFYRLNVLPIYLPPLRQRRDEIASLARHFLHRFAAELGKPVDRFEAAALDLLASHDWPGNLRDLENAIYRAAVLAEGSVVHPSDFPHLLGARDGRNGLTETLPRPSAPVHVDAFIHLLKQMEGPAKTDRFLTGEGEITPLAGLERDLIEFALGHYGGRMSKVARALGIGRSTLYRKLREFGLESAMLADAAE